MLEDQLDHLEGRSPLRSSRNSFFAEKPVDHASLMHRLVSRSDDPFRRSGTAVSERGMTIPRKSIEALLHNQDSVGLSLPIEDITRGLNHSSVEKAELRRERDFERETRMSYEAHCRSLREALSAVS
jgi:hypothetical protein